MGKGVWLEEEKDNYWFYDWSGLEREDSGGRWGDVTFSRYVLSSECRFGDVCCLLGAPEADLGVLETRGKREDGLGVCGMESWLEAPR